MLRTLTAVSSLWLIGIATYGSVWTECASISCVMDGHDLALAAGAQSLALQAVVGYGGDDRRLAAVDAALALTTGLAPYSLAGDAHNYLALALFLVRVYRGIRRPRLGLVYVAVLTLARLFGAVYLHTYACSGVFPDCSYALWTRTVAPGLALWVQTAFILSGVVSIAFVDDDQRPELRYQSVPFVVAFVASAAYAVAGVANASLLGTALFATGAFFDMYFARRLATGRAVWPR